MENKALKRGNECNQGWESNQKYPKPDLVRPILIRKKTEIRVIPGTD